jgi:hypothetical protein
LRLIAANHSALSDLRTNCVHVDLPLHLLHGPILQYYPRLATDRRIRRNGHFRLCICRVLCQRLLGTLERQNWPKTSPPHRSCRNRNQRLSFWLCDQFAMCPGCTCIGRTFKRVCLTLTDKFIFLGRVDKLTTWSSNIGVLQTTVGEVVTVEAHQRMQIASIRTILHILTNNSKSLFYHALCMVSWVGWI